MKLKYINSDNVEAIYSEQIISEYKNNPLIEALPNIMPLEHALEMIKYSPPYDTQEKLFPQELRLHCVSKLKELIIPMNIHLEVEQRISRLIRRGYIRRNPVDPYDAMVHNLLYKDIKEKNNEYIKNIKPTSSTAFGLAFLGISGMGKSTMVERILQSYPKVIQHTNYKGSRIHLTQITYLNLQCPFDASIKGLCFNFFQAIDFIIGTKYYEKFSSRSVTTDQLIPLMAKVAHLHKVGLLIIDEVQNISEVKSGGQAKLLNFFVQLINSINIPIVMIGTPRALGLYTSVFRNGRRGGGEGDITWDRMKNDSEWNRFISEVWKYQWLEGETKLDQELINTMYEESQGITDIAVKLFMMSQWRGIQAGTSTITPSLIKAVAKDHLKLVRHALDALKSNNKNKIQQIEDIYIPDITLDEFQAIENNIEKITNHTQSNKSEEDKLISKISEFLIQGGIPVSKSILTANEIISIYGAEQDVNLLKQKAYLEAMKEDGNKSSGQKSKKEVDDKFLIEKYVKDSNEFL